MENEQEKTTKENTGNHPKPTDDVQLDIETVTPSTEKEIKPEDDAEEKEQSKTNNGGPEDKGESNDDKIETITPTA